MTLLIFRKSGIPDCRNVYKQLRAQLVIKVAANEKACSDP